MPRTVGYREIQGSVLPAEAAKLHRLQWMTLGDNIVVFFAETLLRELNKWVPGSVFRMEGACNSVSRVPKNDFDSRTDSYHRFVLYDLQSEDKFCFYVELLDHRSLQEFTREQLFEYKDETTCII